MILGLFIYYPLVLSDVYRGVKEQRKDQDVVKP